MTNREFIVRVHQEDDEGSFWAEVVDLPGCFASGDTLDELREALEEAIRLCLDDVDPPAAPRPGPDAPEPMKVGEMRVMVTC